MKRVIPKNIPPISVPFYEREREREREREWAHLFKFQTETQNSRSLNLALNADMNTYKYTVRDVYKHNIEMSSIKNHTKHMPEYINISNVHIIIIILIDY